MLDEGAVGLDLLVVAELEEEEPGLPLEVTPECETRTIVGETEAEDGDEALVSFASGLEVVTGPVTRRGRDGGEAEVGSTLGVLGLHGDTTGDVAGGIGVGGIGVHMHGHGDLDVVPLVGGIDFSADALGCIVHNHSLSHSGQ